MRPHDQANHIGAEGTAEPGATVLPSPTPETNIQKIALNQLARPPGGRRKISRHCIQALAARIYATGRLQSLMVVPSENAEFYVVAGERRFAALQLLAGDNRISQTFLVPCRVIAGRATSQTEIAADPDLSASDPDQKRRRFLDLRNHCPGLLTGSEFAARQCFT